MFEQDPSRQFVQLDPDAISMLHRSVTSTTVVLPGRPAASANAVIVGYRVGPKQYGVLVALHLNEARKHLIYAHKDDGLDPEGARAAAEEALAFVESMGFFMENPGFRQLDPVAQREMLVSLKVFMPPEGTTEAPKVVDPRTKLARLLVQF